MEGDEHNWLELDADTGELKTKAPLDRETVEQITLTVIAYETGENTAELRAPMHCLSRPASFGEFYNLFLFLSEGDKQESEMKVNIHLLDVNDNYPKLKWTRNYICIQEMNPLTLTAVDNDADPYGEPFTFALNRKSSNFELKTVDGKQIFSLATVAFKKTGSCTFHTVLNPVLPPF